MSAVALIFGALSCAPESKTAKSGKPYVAATIKVAADNATDYWRIFAFSESGQAELSRLGEGDKVSLQGALKLEVYTSKNGEHKISRTLFVDHVLALRQPPRSRTPKAAPDRRDAGARDDAPRASAAPFDDGLPEQWGPR
jgi:single-stranded DNA-binding protein